MTTLYYINNNRKEPFTIKDIEKGKIIYEDDLIWHDKLDDWVKAKDVPELLDFIRKKPPISKRERNIKRFSKALTMGFLVYFLFSVLIGVVAGLIEKNDFEKFFAEVKVKYDENLEKFESEVNILQSERSSIDFKLDLYSQRSTIRGGNNIPVHDAQAFLRSVNKNEFLDSLKQEKKMIEKRIDDKFNERYSFVRRGEIYTLKNGLIYTRWCSHVDDIFKNEDIAHHSCSKVFMRPYHAIFSDSNLSNEEQNSILVLLFNFSLASLLTHLPLLLVFVPVFYFRNKNLA